MVDYTPLSEAFPDGGDFKSRTALKEGKSEDPPQALRRTNPAATQAVDSVKKSVQENADKPVYGDGLQQVFMYPKKTSVGVQEAFTSQGGDDMKVKMDKILMMVEQNKTGYEPNSTNDMFLYILTGVMFLFTFDTFVMLGKSMRT
jgi:hypothetical protein